MKSILIVLIFVFFISCGQMTSVEKEKPNFQSYQIPGCIQELPINRHTDTTCFNYLFGETLKVDLCLPANCCPDSGRFEYSYLITGDTLKVTVIDIAENLCRCTCDYMVHSDISYLEHDEYIFKCIYYDSVYYQQTIVRN